MKNYAIFRHNKAKFKTNSQISNADRHNLRLMDVPNADPERDAIRIYGGKRTITEFKNMLAKFNIKPRKNAALAMEYMMTFSPEMNGKITIDEWVAENIAFLKREHGEGFLTADLHLDETTPHIHAICAPLIQKEVRGKIQWRLSGVDFWKGKEKLSDRQTRYADSMKQFGLRRGIKGSRAHHTTVKQWRKRLFSLIKDSLIKGNDAVEKMERPGTGRFKAAWINAKDKLKQVVTGLSIATGQIDDYKQREDVLNANMKLLQHELEHSQENMFEKELEAAECRNEALEKSIETHKDVALTLIKKNNEMEEKIAVQDRLLDKYQANTKVY